MQPILHLCQRGDWETAQHHGDYQAGSLCVEGFIHCSAAEQILLVANQFYRSTPGLILLWIDCDRVKAEIKWESVGKEIFPHIYGSLNLDAVYCVKEFKPDPDGFYRVLPLAGEMG
jgi:uncharacterized protein (DUF952 family)